MLVASTTAPSRLRRWKRVLLIAASVSLTLVSLIVVQVSYDTKVSAERLRQAIAQADALDPGWRDIDSQRTAIPDERNSALLLQRVHKMLVDHGWDRSLETPRPPIVSELRKLADMPEGRYPVKWDGNWVRAPLPHIQPARQLVIMIGADAAVRAEAGDTDGAIESCRAMINCGRSLGDDPIFISMLVRTSCRTLALQRTEAVLAGDVASDTALAKLQQLLEREEKEPLFLTALRGERALSDQMFQALENGELTTSALLGPSRYPTSRYPWWRLDRFVFSDIMVRHWPGSITSSRAAFLETMNQAVEIAKLPLEQHADRFEQLQASARMPLLAAYLLPAAAEIDKAWVRSRSCMRCMIAALAAERYRLANNRWPESLDALVSTYLSKVPRDPCDGAPLRCRRTNEGFVVYSVGPDKADNGGVAVTLGRAARGTDWGVRLWDVGVRAPKKKEPKK